MMMRRSEKERNILTKIYFYYQGEKIRRTEVKHCSEFSLNSFCSILDRDRLLGFSEGQDTFVTPNGIDTDFFKQAGAPTIPKSMIFECNSAILPSCASLSAALIIVPTPFRASIWPE
jgi:hypothetical protein